jgi:hypothetical protein
MIFPIEKLKEFSRRILLNSEEMGSSYSLKLKFSWQKKFLLIQCGLMNKPIFKIKESRMSRLLSIVSAVALLATSGSVYADATIAQASGSVPTPKVAPSFFKAGQPISDNDQISAGYSKAASAKPDSSYEFDVDASYILWDVSQDGMAVGRSNNVNVYQHHGYQSGFKLGLGATSNCDDWKFNAGYTWLHFKNHKAPKDHSSEIVTNGTYTSPNFFNGTPSGAISTKWRFHLDQLDLTVARPFYSGKKFILSPDAALRFAWVDQTEYVHLGADHSKTKSKQWSIGSVAHLNSQWLLGKGVRVENVFGAGALFTKVDSIHHEETVGLTTTAFSSHNVRTSSPVLELGLGLGYGTYLAKNKVYLDVAARYDYALIWDQNFISGYAKNREITPQGNLKINGLTVDLSVSF